MHITLWVLQVLLALHTTMGAAWKLSNPEQSVPSLSAIPHGVWLGLSVLELLCAIGLVIPAMKRSLAKLAPFAAAAIAVEMVVFCLVHFASGTQEHAEVLYWLVVAVLSLFITYGRLALKPL